ncbi:hypothetical protein DPMN_056056 [Dreissena polymorpha]|uniref:Uncharacterized protein n=1 Tax=Dreissena polymorpha TaxID=45954 RepID=A0A9D4HR59_DREPO|nr:hypothetical protein DPMN_056056 [Dreissena polymorpha]
MMVAFAAVEVTWTNVYLIVAVTAVKVTWRDVYMMVAFAAVAVTWTKVLHDCSGYRCGGNMDKC